MFKHALFAYAAAQSAGSLKQEVHLPMQLDVCDSSGCQPAQKSVTLDANWRWTHNKAQGAYNNCYEGTSWDKTLCPDPKTCAQNCALEGVTTSDWQTPYGVQSDGKSLTLGFKTGPNVGSRVYLLDDQDTYYNFKLKNREFTFDVDVSNMPCGVNGALYFSQMPLDGGASASNTAGAKFGTGYCDAQCPHDIKFIDGEANIEDWDEKTALGKWGSCCTEMDIWEANKAAHAYTAHPCDVEEATKCDDPVSCGDGDHRYGGHCDKDGCDFNPFRMGDKTFYGEGSSFKVDTTKKMTVVTQFITTDGTDTGDLKEIRRFYVQDGKAIANPSVSLGSQEFSSLSDEMCTAGKTAFGDQDDFKAHGGMKNFGEKLDKGMVLVMSIWDDKEADMLWLDSSYPPSKDAGAPGVTRGPCDPKSGVPADVEAQHPDSHVMYGNIKIGTIGSTTPGVGPAPTPPSPTPPSPAPPSPAPPSPSPSGCPGGSLSACMGFCPSDAAAFEACVKQCQHRCTAAQPLLAKLLI